MRIRRGARASEVARGGIGPTHPDHRAALGAGDQVVADHGRAGALDDADGDADRRTPDDVAGRGDITKIRAPAEHQAVEGRAVDDVAARNDVGLDRDADTEARRVGRIGPTVDDIADDIVGDHRHVAALAEIGDADSGRGAIDDVVGDQRAGEGELRINADLAGVPAVVAEYLDVARRIGTHRGEGAIGNAVIGDDDAVGAENVDAIAVLAGAARLRRDTLDPVTGDDGTVIALAPAPDQDAAVAAILD